MSRFSVDDDGVLFRAEFLRAVPYFLHKGTSGIVFLNFYSLVQQKVFDLECSSERRDDHDIVGGDFLPGNQRAAIGIHNEANPAALQVLIHLLIVDHLAQQKYPLPAIFLYRLVADLDRILNAVAEAKMSGEVKYNRPEIKFRWSKILLSKVFQPSDFLNATGDGRSVICRDVKLFDGSTLSFLTGKSGGLFVLRGQKRKDAAKKAAYFRQLLKAYLPLWCFSSALSSPDRTT